MNDEHTGHNVEGMCCECFRYRALLSVARDLVVRTMDRDAHPDAVALHAAACRMLRSNLDAQTPPLAMPDFK